MVTELNNKKAAIYIRVSTDAQIDGYSIDAQKEQLTAYCISKGIKNYTYYIDGGWSGSNIYRPQMQKMIADIEQGLISHVIIYKLDRLSRSQKDTLYLIEDVFINNDIEFVSLTETIDTSTPMGKLMIGILSAFAQLERENIRMRTKMGMKERVKQGYWMGGGRLPYGYDYDSAQGILVKNKDAENVVKIFTLYCDGYAPQVIADSLGLKYDTLIYKILSRKTYYGIIEYNGEEYQGKHEPIVSKELYDKARRCMLERSKIKTPTSNHLLTGLCFCGECGAKMRYQKWGDKHKLVCYSQQTSKQYLVKDANCKNDKVTVTEIEKAVLDFIFNLNEKKETQQIKNESTNLLDTLEKQHEEKTKRIKKLYLLYASTEDEILLDTIEDLKNDLLKLESKIDKEKELTELQSMQDETNEIVSNLKDTWQYMTIKEKQKVIRILIKKITINHNDISIDIRI